MNNPFGISPEHLLGEGTQHVPMNFIVRQGEGGKVWGVFQSSNGESLRYEETESDVLILGDAFIRPHLVMSGKHLLGSSASRMVTHGFAEIEKWTDDGELIYQRVIGEPLPVKGGGS